MALSRRLTTSKLSTSYLICITLLIRVNSKISVSARSTIGDPIEENLRSGKRFLGKHLLAGLAISLESRRRNKLTGYVEEAEFDKGSEALNLSVRVTRTLGNCPSKSCGSKRLREFVLQQKGKSTSESRT